MPRWVRIPLIGVPGTHLDWLKSLTFHCYNLLSSTAYLLSGKRSIRPGWAHLVFLPQGGLTHYGLASIGGPLRE
jgi:hypothetical protein